MDQTLIKLRIDSILQHIDSITSDLRDKILEEFQNQIFTLEQLAFR